MKNMATLAGFVIIGSVWGNIDKRNGVYGDFELIVPGKTIPSTQDWSKI